MLRGYSVFFVYLESTWLAPTRLESDADDMKIIDQKKPRGAVIFNVKAI